MRGDEPEDLLGNLHRALRPVRPPNPFVLVYRWRYEVAAVVGTVFAIPWIMGLPTSAVVGLAALVVLPLVVPQVRRLVARRLRGIVVQHRARTAFVRARLHTNSGRIPIILWTSPREFADRLLIAIPSGLTPELLAAEADRIAVGCFGTHAEVILCGDRRWLVWLVIARE